MSSNSWRVQVAEHLERSAKAIREQRDRQAATEFGVALGYLMRHDGDLEAKRLYQALSEQFTSETTVQLSYRPEDLDW